MALHNLQRALVAMLQNYPQQLAVGAELNSALPDFDNGHGLVATLDGSAELSAAEKKWLANLSLSPGFQVTSEIRQWWRLARLKVAAPLTLRAVEKFARQGLLNRYIREEVCTTLFFVPEALAFCKFICAQAHHCPPLNAIARFESAVKTAHEYRDLLCNSPAAVELARHEVTVRCSAYVRLIYFPVPVAPLLDYLLNPQITELPLRDASQASYPVLVAPQLPHLWRSASQSECDILESLGAASLSADSLTEIAPETSQSLTVAAGDSALYNAVRRLTDQGVLILS